MKRTVLKLTAITLSAIAVFVISNRNTQAELGAAPIAPQDKPVEQVRKNIKVLTGLPDSQLIPVMNFMAASLGRRCNFCHVTDKGRDGYALDDKPEKNTARQMIKMLLDLRKMSFHGADEMTCFTCHRGREHPVNLPALPLPTPLPRPSATPSPTPAPGAVPGLTQESPPPLPTADSILSNYIAAIGGQANLDKLRSRTAKGSVAQPNGTVTFEIAQSAPDKFHITATTPTGAFQRGFNGSVGWEKGPQGVRALAPAEVAQLQNSVGLFRHIRLKEQFTSLRSRGTQLIGDRPVYVVIGTTADNRQERLFFDTQTGLLLRRISYMATLLGLIPEQIDFEDYRDVDGVKFPFVVRVSSIEVGNPVSTRAFSEMKLNGVVDEGKFHMPPATPQP